MKWIVFILSFSALSSYASSNPQECLKITNNIDRRYCLDKYLETVKNKHEAEKKTWSKGLPQAAKDQRISALEHEIQAKKEWMNLMQSEVSFSEKQLTELKAVPVAKAAPAKKEKKKKKKEGFRIKL